MARQNLRRQWVEEYSNGSSSSRSSSSTSEECGDETKVRIKKETAAKVRSKSKSKSKSRKSPKNSKIFRLIQTAIFCEEEQKYEEAKKFWKGTLKYIQKEKENHPDVLKDATKYEDEIRRTPLLLATEGNAPFEVIRALIHANVESCNEPYMYNNAYALHYACSGQKKRNKPQQQQILQRNPEPTIRLLMETCPQAIMKQHDDGNVTALHLLLEIRPSLKLVKDMIQLSNNQVVGKVKIERNSILNMKDSENQLPIHVAIQWEASDDVILYLCESFPNGLNEILGADNNNNNNRLKTDGNSNDNNKDNNNGDDRLSCLHLAIFHKRYNVIGKIAELRPEKIRFKSKSGNSPLHLLLKHKEHKVLSKDIVHSIFRQLLISYKKYLVENEKSKVNAKMKYLLKAVKDKANHNIIQVAEKAMKQNHPGVTPELVQMLKDVSQGNYSSLDQCSNDSIQRTIVKTEDHGLLPHKQADGKRRRSDKNHNAASSSRTSSQTSTTLKITNRKRSSTANHHTTSTTGMNQEKKQKHTRYSEVDGDKMEQRMAIQEKNTTNSSNKEILEETNNNMTKNAEKNPSTTKINDLASVEPISFFDDNEATFSDVSLDRNDDKSISISHDDDDDLPIIVDHDKLMMPGMKILPLHYSKDVPKKKSNNHCKKF